MCFVADAGLFKLWLLRVEVLFLMGHTLLVNKELPRPILLTLFSPIMIIIGAGFILISVLSLFTSGSLKVEGQLVGKQAAYFVVLGFTLPYGISLLISGIGFWKGLPWSRVLWVVTLAVAPILFSALMFFTMGQFFFTTLIQQIPIFIFAGIVYWYLFKRKNVDQYFSAR